MKRLFLCLFLFAVTFCAFADKRDVLIRSRTFDNPEEKIDNFIMCGEEFYDSNSAIIWIEYAINMGEPDEKYASWVRYNNPYEVEPRDGAQDQILFYKDHNTNKYYVGHYSLITNAGYSYAMVAFEFDTFADARNVFFLWLSLKYLQSTKMTEVHFPPSGTEFCWDENGDYFYANIPKDMIDTNYRLYKSRGYYNAFTGKELLIDGEWHDLTDGKTFKRKNEVYSIKNGKLYCNDDPAYLQNDINKMIRIYKYHNSQKFLSLLKNGPGYYYCERCSNNPYGGGLRPIEFYGYHYQDVISKNNHKEKVAGLRNTQMMLEIDWRNILGVK